MSKFCSYCRKFKENLGFRTVVSLRTKTPRYMCEPCQDIRKIPQKDLQARADRDREEKKGKR